MQLSTWRELNQKTFAECAGIFGAANGKVAWRWERGEAIPRRAQMLRIYLATGGQVTPNDFYDLPALPALESEAA